MRPRRPWLPVVLGVALLSTASSRPNSLLDSLYARSARVTGADGPVYAVADAHLSGVETVALETMAGGLARDCPRVFRVSDSESEHTSYGLWLRELEQAGVETDTTFLSDLPGLITHFADVIDGYVRFEPASPNVAITYAAGYNGTVVAVGSDAMEQIVIAANLSQVADLRNTSWSAVFNNTALSFHPQRMCFQPASKAKNMASYSIFARAPTTEYVSDDHDVALILSRAVAPAVAFGWGPEEDYVSHLGTHGVYVHASDWAKDMAPLTNLPSLVGFTRQREEVERHLDALVQRENTRNREALERHADRLSASTSADVHTVTFVLTDGDNIQWLLGDWPTDRRFYGADERGQVPFGWTLSPALIDLAPTALAYILHNKTDNDVFIASPSGIGYTFPEAISNLPTFGNLTFQAMATSRLSILNVIGHSTEPAYLGPLIDDDTVRAMVYYTFADGYSGEAGRVQFIGGKPIVGGRASLWGNATSGPMLDVDPLVDLIASLPRNSSDVSGYSLVPVHAWTHNYSDVVRAVSKLKLRGGVDVVTPSEFMARLIAGVRPVPCPRPTGSYSSSCTECRIDASCVMTCSCQQGAVKEKRNSMHAFRNSSCNLACCSDLSNVAGDLVCDGRTCPVSC